MADFRVEVDRFRVWALGSPQDFGEWEDEYEDWPDIYEAFERFVDDKPPAQWTSGEWCDVLYAIARDNESTQIVDHLVERHPDMIRTIAARARQEGESLARSELAYALGQVAVERDACERLLLDFCGDDDVLVRTEALEALAELGSPQTERIGLKAWDREGESQFATRKSVLDALHKVGAPSFDRLLAAAEADESAALSDYAAHMRRWIADGAEEDMPWWQPSQAALLELGLPPPPGQWRERRVAARLSDGLRRLFSRRESGRTGKR